MVMSSNGTARSPSHNALSSTPKTAADVSFAPTTLHASSTPSPSERASKDPTGDRKKERQLSSGGKLKARWSLRSRSSVLRVKQTRTDSEDEQRPTSSGVQSSRSVKEEELQVERDTSERDGRHPSHVETSVDHEKDQHTFASSSKTSSTYSPEPVKANGMLIRDEPMRTPELNPAQLVQMALNLSESRRRHSSLPGMLLGTPEAPSVRNPLFNSPPRQQRKSPLQATELSEDSYRDSPSARTSDKVDAHANKPSSLPSSLSDPTVEHFSPATLVRAERARNYFELADQHRRLLNILQTSSPARYASTNGESSASGQHNPLRALRNKRKREAGSPMLYISPATFQDVANVEEWIDQVRATVEDNRGSDLDGDYVGLPQIANADYVQTTNPSSHRRTCTADTVVQRAGNAWSITPTELLADIYSAIHGDSRDGDNTIPAQPVETRKDVHTGSQNGHTRRGASLQHVDSLADNSEGVRRRFLPLKAADRLRGTRLTRRTRSASASSASSVEAANKSLFDPNMNNLNIAPLRRHVNHLIETQERILPSTDVPLSPDHWGMAKAQQYAARQRATSRAGAQQRPEPPRKGRQSIRDSPIRTHEHVLTDPSSGDVSRQASPSKQPTLSRSATKEKHAMLAKTGTVKHRPTPSRAKSNLSNDDPSEYEHTAQPKSSTTNYQDHAIDTSRLSVESARPNLFRRQRTTDSTPSSFFSRTQSGKDADLVEPTSAVTRPRLAGRFVDKVRSEGARFGDKVRYKDSRHKVPTMGASARNSDVSDVEATVDVRVNDKHVEAEDGITPLEPTASRNRFHIPHLPSFKSPANRDAQTLTPIMSNESGDHISRQQAALRLQNRSPRFQRLAPPPIDPTGKWPRSEESKEEYASTVSDHERLSTEKARTSLDYESGDIPVSEDRLLDEKQPRLTRDNLQRHTENYGSISSRDIARVRTLLVASGIKARALSQQLQSPSTEGSTLLTASARACNLDTRIVTQKARIDQAPHAARVLCAYLDDSVRATHERVQAFQAQRLQPLITKQEVLKSRVSEDLAELVHSTTDQADAFNVELSTQATLLTKQVDDAIDKVLRLRRRQFRLVRQALFKLLEWLVLAVLWWVWFVVVCFNTVSRLIIGIFRFLRWLFTF